MRTTILLVAILGTALMASVAAAATPLSKQDKALFTYAKCMRGKGVKIPDPVKGKNGAYAFPAIPTSITGAPGVRAKAQACSRTAGLANAGSRPQRPALTAAQQKKLEQFQACLKKHGVTRAFGRPGDGTPPDGGPRSGQVPPSGQAPPAGAQRRQPDAKTQKAMAACQKYSPFPAGGLRGPGGAGSAPAG